MFGGGIRMDTRFPIRELLIAAFALVAFGSLATVVLSH
jgi:hypothetical protein